MAEEVSEVEFAREQQDRQIENDPHALFAENMREEKAANILGQLNPDNLLSDIEHRLRGERYNVISQDWDRISEKSEPVSEEMIGKFISFLGAILNQNTSMSNFSSDEIANLMEMIYEWVISDLITNASNYGIEGDYTEYTRIGHIICLSCYTVFKRAMNGRESLRIFKIMKVSESLGETKKKGGILETLNPFR